jgi:hypothetical protein
LNAVINPKIINFTAGNFGEEKNKHQNNRARLLLIRNISNKQRMGQIAADMVCTNFYNGKV